VNHPPENIKSMNMKKAISILVACWFLINVLYSQQTTHIVRNLGIQKGSVSTNTMTSRIKDAAVSYESYAPIPRIAVFDFAFPADLPEYNKLNGYGILYVASLNQDTTEYPIKRVFVKLNDGNSAELKLIGSIKVPIDDKTIKKVFGPNRIDYYYYFPYYLTIDKGQLMIDWTKNRSDFVLQQFPSDSKLDFIKGSNKPIIGVVEKIDTSAFNSFSIREFQILLK
jgi:hypothetical protein